MANLKHAQYQEKKRQDIVAYKAKRLNQIQEKLVEIDQERESRRQLRVQKSLPDRQNSISTQLNSNDTKAALLEQNPVLGHLQAKLNAKKAGIVNT